MAQKPPDLDEKGKPIKFKPPDIPANQVLNERIAEEYQNQILQENARSYNEKKESSIDDRLVEAKKSLAPKPPAARTDIKPVITASDEFGANIEPTDYWGGFRKSIKDQFFEATTGNPMLQGAAKPKGESKIETLGNIGNLLLPAGMESAIAGAKALRGKKTGNVAKIAEEVAKPIESKLNLSSELPSTKEPILDASGRDIAPSQQMSEHGPYPNYPTKGSNIFQRMGMGVDRADDVARGNIAAEKVTPKKLPYKTKDGKLYLKEVTKENIDQLYNGGYELNPDGSIVKSGEKAAPKNNVVEFGGKREKIVSDKQSITGKTIRDKDYEKLWNNQDEDSFSAALDRHTKSISEELDPEIIYDNYNNWLIEFENRKLHGTVDDIETAGMLRDEALDRIRRLEKNDVGLNKIQEAKPTANFAYHQDDFEGGSIPLYNVEGGPLHRSSVSAETLGEHGISIPDTPPFDPNFRGGKPTPFEEQVLSAEEPLDFSKTSDRLASDTERMERERVNAPRNIEQEDKFADHLRTEQNSARYEGRNTNDVNTPLTREQQIIRDSYDKIRAHENAYNQKFTEAEDILPEGEFYTAPPEVEAAYKAEQAVLKDAHQKLVDRLAPLEKERLPDIEVPFADKVLGAPVDNSAPLFSGGKGRKAKPVEKVDTTTGEIVDDALPAEQPPLPKEAQAAEPPKVPPDDIIPENTGGGDNIPPEGNDGIPEGTPPKEVNKLQQWWNLSRDLMSTDMPFVTSAAFRQGSTQVGTVPWLQAWGKAFKAYGSKGAADMMDTARLKNPLFAESTAPVMSKSGQPIIDKITGLPKTKRVPSLAEEAGLRTGDFNRYDNPNIMNLAERIPIYGKHITASNRAFNAFVNHIMEAKFTQLVDDGEKLAATAKSTGKARPGFFKVDAPDPSIFDPKINKPLAKKIADFVNTSVKRGNFGIEAGNKGINLDKHIEPLANIFFSPRNMASEVRMLNPSTYITAPPEIRIQYMANLARRLSMWGGIATLAKINGADVSLNPTNADFGKIKLGDTRIDLPGGLQQFLVLGARMYAGGTISSTKRNAKFQPFGKGYPPQTVGSTIGRFVSNRLHPSAKFPVDASFADEDHPFHTGDRVVQLMAPMFVDDMTEVFKRYPELTPVMGFLSSAGIGTQSYERGSFGKSKYIDDKIDFNIGTKR